MAVDLPGLAILSAYFLAAFTLVNVREILPVPTVILSFMAVPHLAVTPIFGAHQVSPQLNRDTSDILS
jgi:hypothetical protein